MSAVTENAIIQKLLHIFKFWPGVDKGELLPLVGKLYYSSPTKGLRSKRRSSLCIFQLYPLPTRSFGKIKLLRIQIFKIYTLRKPAKRLHS